MTVKELANLCNVHYNTMRKWLSDNKIKKADKAGRIFFSGTSGKPN